MLNTDLIEATALAHDGGTHFSHSEEVLNDLMPGGFGTNSVRVLTAIEEGAADGA